jgi:hypothetical protein
VKAGAADLVTGFLVISARRRQLSQMAVRWNASMHPRRQLTAHLWCGIGARIRGLCAILLCGHRAIRRHRRHRVLGPSLYRKCRSAQLRRRSVLPRLRVLPRRRGKRRRHVRRQPGLKIRVQTRIFFVKIKGQLSTLALDFLSAY